MLLSHDDTNYRQYSKNCCTFMAESNNIIMNELFGLHRYVIV